MNARIRNGEFSERGLAAILGISQPQLHNVLKGVRALQPSLADALLSHFQISVIDLLTASELARVNNLNEAVSDAEAVRLRLLRKKSARFRTSDRSEWEAG